jgi:hypothetical protein
LLQQKALISDLQGGPAGTALQRFTEEEEKPVQGRFGPQAATAQRAEKEEEKPLQGRLESGKGSDGRMDKEEEKPVQGRFSAPATQRKQDAAADTGGGLPANLKRGVESLSGVAMDGVKVHYNSDKPAQLNALAYTQGSEIHVGPGQEQHLPHEAWHVVQQAQGRVQPTTQLREGVPVNDDSSLEREADVMGGKAEHGA